MRTHSSLTAITSGGSLLILGCMLTKIHFRSASRSDWCSASVYSLTACAERCNRSPLFVLHTLRHIDIEPLDNILHCFGLAFVVQTVDERHVDGMTDSLRGVGSAKILTQGGPRTACVCHSECSSGSTGVLLPLRETSALLLVDNAAVHLARRASYLLSVPKSIRPIAWKRMP